MQKQTITTTAFDFMDQDVHMAIQPPKLLSQTDLLKMADDTYSEDASMSVVPMSSSSTVASSSRKRASPAQQSGYEEDEEVVEGKRKDYSARATTLRKLFIPFHPEWFEPQDQSRWASLSKKQSYLLRTPGGSSIRALVYPSSDLFPGVDGDVLRLLDAQSVLSRSSILFPDNIQFYEPPKTHRSINTLFLYDTSLEKSENPPTSSPPPPSWSPLDQWVQQLHNHEQQRVHLRNKPQLLDSLVSRLFILLETVHTHQLYLSPFLRLSMFKILYMLPSSISDEEDTLSEVYLDLEQTIPILRSVSSTVLTPVRARQEMSILAMEMVLGGDWLEWSRTMGWDSPSLLKDDKRRADLTVWCRMHPFTDRTTRRSDQEMQHAKAMLVTNKSSSAFFATCCSVDAWEQWIQPAFSKSNTNNSSDNNTNTSWILESPNQPFLSKLLSLYPLFMKTVREIVFVYLTRLALAHSSAITLEFWLCFVSILDQLLAEARVETNEFEHDLVYFCTAWSMTAKYLHQEPQYIGIYRQFLQDNLRKEQIGLLEREVLKTERLFLSAPYTSISTPIGLLTRRSIWYAPSIATSPRQLVFAFFASFNVVLFWAWMREEGRMDLTFLPYPLPSGISIFTHVSFLLTQCSPYSSLRDTPLLHVSKLRMFGKSAIQHDFVWNRFSDDGKMLRYELIDPE